MAPSSRGLGGVADWSWLHWWEGGNARAVASHIAPLWGSGGFVLRGENQWALGESYAAPDTRMIIFEGWGPGARAADTCHAVGLTWHRHPLCARFGELTAGEGLLDVAHDVLRWMPSVWQAWYFVLLPRCLVEGQAPALTVEAGAPEWERRVGHVRLCGVVTAVLEDWYARTNLVRGFSNEICGCKQLH